MERTGTRGVELSSLVLALMAASVLVTGSGCGQMLATGMYVIQGGNTVPAEFFLCDSW